MADPHRKPATEGANEGANEGEGSRTADRRYVEGVREHVRDHDMDADARRAREAIDGPEAEDLRRAEEKGRSRAKEEDPQVKR